MTYSNVSSAPATEPLTPAEAKAQLNISSSFTGDDTLITAQIKAAREWLERRMGTSFITQTRVQYMDRFPYSIDLELLYGPVQSITTVAYYDSADSSQTVDPSAYWLDTSSLIPKMRTKTQWPGTGDRPAAVQITYVTGYGDNASDVPEPIRDAMKLLVAHMYQNRVPEVEGVALGKIEFGIERLISLYSRMQFTGHA